MIIESPVSLFGSDDFTAPAGHPERFTQRWRFIGAGVSNVWRYGDLIMDAQSGRLLLRGPNGTGKTTLLEGLWPYLLDLNAQRLSAGKARPTSLSSLMREGATGSKRCGYLWITLAAPDGAGIFTYGVRLNWTMGGSPQVKPIPFTIPGVPLQDLALYGPNREILKPDEFAATITELGGQVFADEDAYVTHLASRVWRATEQELRDLANRIRAVRNPSLLGEVSPQAAADALRDALPGVSDDVVVVTAEALAASESTRLSFERDRDAAKVITRFADVWGGHVVDVVTETHREAQDAATAVKVAAKTVRSTGQKVIDTLAAVSGAETKRDSLESERIELAAAVTQLEHSDAFLNAGRLTDLLDTLTAAQNNADARIDNLVTAAQAASARGTALGNSIDQAQQDLDDLAAQAIETDGRAGLPGTPLTPTVRPRAVLRVGERTADPGPQHLVSIDVTVIDVASQQWTALAAGHRTRAAAAGLAITDYRDAADAKAAADTAAAESRTANTEADKANAASNRALHQAREASAALLERAGAWSEQHPHLADGDLTAMTAALPDIGVDVATDDDPVGAHPPDLMELRTAEPSQINDEMDRWHENIAITANAAVQAHKNSRAQAQRQAKALRADAEHLIAQAARLRAGQFLPIPRPDWAGPADDDHAFAATVEWQADVTDDARTLIEAALSASGLLGATVTTSGAHTDAWSVSVIGAPVTDNLSSVLVVDPSHPDAHLVTEILTRIRLADNTADDRPDTCLTIGRDGAFRTGSLQGKPAEAASIATASHVGARQRRETALEHARRLDEQAKELILEAGELDTAAAVRASDIAKIRQANDSFPPRNTAHNREAERVAAARRAKQAAEEATAASETAADKAETARDAHTEWCRRTEARALPANLDQLRTLRDNGERLGRQLDAYTRTLSKKTRSRLHQLAKDAENDAQANESIPALHNEARRAAAKAEEVAAEYRQLKIAVGPDAAKAAVDYETVKNLRDAKIKEQSLHQDTLIAAAAARSKAESEHQAAQKNLEAAEPHAARQLAELTTVLAAPGVTDILFPPPGEEPGNTATPLTIPQTTLPRDDNALTAVKIALHGKQSSTRKALREHYDEARTTLAGIWTIEHGDTIGDLDTFFFTHDTITYTPPAAKARATHLHQEAENALAAADESALNNFVVGRLPAAITTAWIHINDWVDQVNNKMTRAAASSGVGVQVSKTLSRDLSAAATTVHQLCCKSSDARRTPAQQSEVGAALQSLIAAADGETMAERLAKAVDVRQWVDLRYEIVRPEHEPQRWTSKTGLSGGERRLVVLAPMLAAVAACYDQLDLTGLRLTALDEVPAEVDERGREGLARYIAELDLDLLCTSYLWDGAPGAWDGIDAWDLEAAPDNTVVAFPMLIRGTNDLPGDRIQEFRP